MNFLSGTQMVYMVFYPLFISHTAGLIDVFMQHGLQPHLYADDTQIPDYWDGFTGQMTHPTVSKTQSTRTTPPYYSENTRQLPLNPLLITYLLCQWLCWTVQEQIEAYKAKKKAIDAAPIKKVAEAKARKKRKVSVYWVTKFMNNFVPFCVCVTFSSWPITDIDSILYISEDCAILCLFHFTMAVVAIILRFML